MTGSLPARSGAPASAEPSAMRGQADPGPAGPAGLGTAAGARLAAPSSTGSYLQRPQHLQENAQLK